VNKRRKGDGKGKENTIIYLRIKNQSPQNARQHCCGTGTAGTVSFWPTESGNVFLL
jgi:hypothetical protein